MALTSFGDLWVAAAAYRKPRRQALSDPAAVLERVRALAGKPTAVQLFDAEPLLSLRQVHAAAVAAYLSFKAGTNIARRMDVEVLLRLAADTQIGRALERLGVKADSEEVGVCILAQSEGEARRVIRRLAAILGGEEIGEEELRSEERVEKALRFYGVGREELEAVQAESRWEAALLLVLERIATLDVER